MHMYCISLYMHMKLHFHLHFHLWRQVKCRASLPSLRKPFWNTVLYCMSNLYLKQWARPECWVGSNTWGGPTCVSLPACDTLQQANVGPPAIPRPPPSAGPSRPTPQQLVHGAPAGQVWERTEESQDQGAWKSKEQVRAKINASFKTSVHKMPHFQVSYWM